MLSFDDFAFEFQHYRNPHCLHIVHCLFVDNFHTRKKFKFQMQITSIKNWFKNKLFDTNCMQILQKLNWNAHLNSPIECCHSCFMTETIVRHFQMRYRHIQGGAMSRVWRIKIDSVWKAYEFRQCTLHFEPTESKARGKEKPSTISIIRISVHKSDSICKSIYTIKMVFHVLCLTNAQTQECWMSYV